MTDCELVAVLLLCQQTIVRLIGICDQSLSMPNSIIAKEYCSNYKHAALTLKKRYQQFYPILIPKVCTQNNKNHRINDVRFYIVISLEKIKIL